MTFNVVETLQPSPIRIKIYPGLDFEVGQVVEFFSGYCCLLSDGSSPFGIIGGEKDEFGLVPVWYDSMVLQIGTFDRSRKYKTGDRLYSNYNGYLTNQPPNGDSYHLGFVIHAPEKDRDFLEINWI